MRFIDRAAVQFTENGRGLFSLSLCSCVRSLIRLPVTTQFCCIMRSEAAVVIAVARSHRTGRESILTRRKNFFFVAHRSLKIERKNSSREKNSSHAFDANLSRRFRYVGQIVVIFRFARRSHGCFLHDARRSNDGRDVDRHRLVTQFLLFEFSVHRTEKFFVLIHQISVIAQGRPNGNFTLRTKFEKRSSFAILPIDFRCVAVGLGIDRNRNSFQRDSR